MNQIGLNAWSATARTSPDGNLCHQFRNGRECRTLSVMPCTNPRITSSRHPGANDFQFDALAGEDLGLSVQRKVVVVLGDDDVGEQSRSGAAAGNGVIG